MNYSMEEERLIELFVENLLETNRGFNFYVNWNNAEAYKEFEIELNSMDVLIGNSDIKEKFFELVKKVPTVILTFPLLFALSKSEREQVWNGSKKLSVVGTEIGKDENLSFSFAKKDIKEGLDDNEIEQYYFFFEKIGLKHLFENMVKKSLVDYVIGVLVGLDTNGRKNRGGEAFELACTPVITEICERYGVTVITQKQFNILIDYGFELNEDIKNRKADFILLKDDKCINIEVDFFFAAGSKPEEIIDSYINRKNDLEKIGLEFILITDGLCWNNNTKNQLRKGFRNLDHLMNFYLAKEGMLEEIIKEYFK